MHSEGNRRGAVYATNLLLATGKISKQKQHSQQLLSYTKLRAYLDPDVHSQWQG